MKEMQREHLGHPSLFTKRAASPVCSSHKQTINAGLPEQSPRRWAGGGLPEGTPRTTSALQLNCARYFKLGFKGVPSHQYGLSKQWITTPSRAYVADDGVEVVRVVNDGANQANGDEQVDAKLEQLRCNEGDEGGRDCGGGPPDLRAPSGRTSDVTACAPPGS